MVICATVERAAGVLQRFDQSGDGKLQWPEFLWFIVYFKRLFLERTGKLAPLADAARHLGVAWEPRGSAGDLRRLAKGLAKVMGKKVYNKVVRNRNEGVPEDVT